MERTRIKYTVLFLPRKRNPDDVEAHLACRVKWNGSRSMVTLNLGFVVDPAKWDAAGQCCVRRSFHGKLGIPAQTINAEIRRYSDAVARVFGSFSQEGCWPTVDQVRGELRAELGIDERKALLVDDAFAMFIAEESVRAAWSDSTLKKMRTVRSHMSSFPPFATFDGFTSANLSRYLEYLRETKGHNDETCQRQLGYLRWFLSWCERRRYLPIDDYRRFQPKFKTPDKAVIFLTWDELMRLWDYEAPKEHLYLNTVRDIFLFSCFTSLRYSDVMSLTWAQVGPVSFSAVQVKTAKTVQIQFNEYSQEVLSRYVDVAVDAKGHVFPRVPNQVMNRYLKVIGRACGFDDKVMITEYHGARRSDQVFEKWQLLSTHAGRRTFICNALMLGISPTIVMQWTGHSDYRAMKPYIAVSDTAKAEAMSLFDERKRGTNP